MTDKPLSEILQETPVICAVKSFKELEASLHCDSHIIFILFGDVLSVSDIVAKIKAADKLAFIHMDLIEGLSPKEVSVDFLAQNTEADGIISTKIGIVKRAKKLNLFTIYRCFVLDSLSLKNIKKQIPFENADALEILPGAMPKTIKTIVGLTDKPVIASGLILDKEDVMCAIKAGATSVSSTNPGVWRV
ncbi:MAG: glycerol-3-phosphate responsive antiterminator [Defluviitaleaceae bacterium]|nr:glycerol-3-phosphate responsive antiterminator [Defluviitaleaceae bacterium]